MVSLDFEWWLREGKSSGVHVFPHLPVDVSLATPSEVSIVRETLSVLFVRHPGQSQKTFVVVIGSSAYYIDWSESCVIGLEMCAALLLACADSWPGDTWTHRVGDPTAMLVGGREYGENERASYRYAAWPSVLDMDYISSTVSICGKDSQQVSSDYVDAVLASWCIGRDVVCFPTLNVLEEACGSDQYRCMLRIYLEVVRSLACGGERFTVVSFSIASASPAFRKKMKKRKRGSEQMLEQEYGKQMMGTDGKRGMFAYHIVLVVVDSLTLTSQVLHGMDSKSYGPSLEAIGVSMMSVFPEHRFKQMPERRSVSSGRLWPFQDKYWTNCGPVACALLYLLVVADVDMESMCMLPNRVVRDLYTEMTKVTNGRLLSFLSEPTGGGRYALVDDLRTDLSTMTTIPVLSVHGQIRSFMATGAFTCTFHDTLEKLVSSERRTFVGI